MHDVNEVVMVTTPDRNLTDWCDVSAVLLWTPGLSIPRHTYAPLSIVSIIIFYMQKSEYAGASSAKLIWGESGGTKLVIMQRCS
jgi:hypothetical protein